MGTRSDIIVRRADGKFAKIYCHWDGYLSHNGKILFEHYSDQAKAEALAALGSLSSLGASPEKPDGHTYAKPVEGYCVAYGRDRGDTDSAAEVFDTLAAAWPDAETWTEFTYVWQDGAWWVAEAEEGSQALRHVGDCLAGHDCIAPRVFVPFMGRDLLAPHEPNR